MLIRDKTRFWWSTIGISLSAAALCLLVLTGLHAELVRLHEFDVGVQTRVHGWASACVTPLMLALTGIGSIAVFTVALLVVLVALIWKGHLHAAVVLGGALAGAFVLNEGLKTWFHRARPVVPWSVGDEKSFSFPSGHSLFSMVLYGTLAYLALRHARTFRRHNEILIPAVVLPLGIGLSRIYLGMHWPTDVLAGWTTGLIWLGAVLLIDVRWRGLRKN